VVATWRCQERMHTATPQTCSDMEPRPHTGVRATHSPRALTTRRTRETPTCRTAALSKDGRVARRLRGRQQASVLTAACIVRLQELHHLHRADDTSVARRGPAALAAAAIASDGSVPHPPRAACSLSSPRAGGLSPWPCAAPGLGAGNRANGRLRRRC
jgi:hypothetical protein